MVDFNIAPVDYQVKFTEGNVSSVHVGISSPINYVSDKEGRARIEGKFDSPELNRQRYSNWIDRLDDNADLLVCGRLGEAEGFEKGQYRWAAGGLLPRLASGEAVFVYRDAGAPSYPDSLTIASGLSSMREELFDPRLIMLREGAFEEIITITAPATIKAVAIALLNKFLSRNNFPPITTAKKTDILFIDKTKATGAMLVAYT